MIVTRTCLIIRITRVTVVVPAILITASIIDSQNGTFNLIANNVRTNMNNWFPVDDIVEGRISPVKK